MLTQSTVMAMVAASNLAAGKTFYEQTLGLKSIAESPGGITYACGQGRLFVYPSPTAGQNPATSATWEVKDIDGIVADLKSKNVRFERYDIPGSTYDGDIADLGPVRAAWFRDPDGNILSLTCVKG